MEPFLREKITYSTFSTMPDDFGGTEFSFRLQGGRVVQTSATKTQTISSGMEVLVDGRLRDIELLGSVIFWQKRIIDYQALHAAFLLNSISEDDFETESEKFMIHQVKVDPENVAAVVARLDNLIGLRLDTSDYANYFHCSQENIMDGLRKLSNPHFVAMLPAPSSESESSY